MKDAENTDSNDGRLLKIILMHGTWATAAEWPLETGQLQTLLRDRFGDKIEMEALGWGGKNRNAHRQAGAKKLAEFIRSEPEIPHVVIAHSHAGNIVSYACANPEIKKSMAGVVTMATPFIVARRRYGAISLIATLMMVVAIYLGFCVDTVLPADYTLISRAPYSWRCSYYSVWSAIKLPSVG